MPTRYNDPPWCVKQLDIVDEVAGKLHQIRSREEGFLGHPHGQATHMMVRQLELALAHNDQAIRMIVLDIYSYPFILETSLFHWHLS